MEGRAWIPLDGAPMTSIARLCPYHKDPGPSADLESTVNMQDAYSSIYFGISGRYKPIKAGDQFIVRTENPKTHPLPSIKILDLQFHLQRLAATSAAGADYNIDISGDDED